MSAHPDLQSQPASPDGAFTPAALAAHLAEAAHLPDWWRAIRREAGERFHALPLPRRTEELWRFSNVAGLTLDGYRLPEAAARLPKLPTPPFAHAATLLFANNRAQPTAPLPDDLRRQGVVFCPLETALVEHADLFRQYFLAQPANLGAEKFAALNAALTTSGAFLFVPRNVEVAQPFAVMHLLAGAGGAVFPHTLVILEDNAKATLVEHFHSTDRGAGFSSGVNDLHAGAGSQLTYVGVQDWSRDTLAFQLNSTVVQRDARVLSLNVHLGGRQARHESHSRLQGPGAFSEMLALTVAHGTQEFDQRTLQSHQAPHTGSNLLYKNALFGRARTIFSGLIVVDPDAQKTDAYQSNRNLLLSDQAESNSLPGLEIQANDVRCTHGATSGHVDDEQMFYLQSRGITPEVARQLLVFGFFEEVLEKLADEEIRSALRDLIQGKFER